MTTYIPLFMGNQLLFWSNRYWDERNPVFQGRIKAKDLINQDLHKEISNLSVFSFSDLMEW